MANPQAGVWGIDLGQCALKAIRLENIDGEITATAFDYIEHPKILSQPDADPDELTREALEQFLSRNELKGDTVVIAVPGQSGLARFVKLPPVEEKKIAEIVRFEAKQQIPFPLDEVVWDFQKIGQGMVTDGFAMDTEIGLFAMKRDMVNRYMQHFSDVNVEIHYIQMAPLGLCNFVSYDLLGKEGASGESEDDDEGGKKECIVALDIGTDSSNLVITDGEKIIWQRPIPLGGNHFTRALTKDLKLTFAKAEHLKRNAVKSPDLKKILSSLKPVLNDFVSEVQRSLGYFTNTHRDASIQYMVGLGNAFRLPGLQKYLQEKLQLEVRKLHSLERVVGDEVVTAPTFTENVLSFAVAYGLALQGLQVTRIQTNLLPREIMWERMIKAKKPWAAAAAAALLVGVAGLAWGKHLEASSLNNPAIESAKQRLAAVKSQLTANDAAFRDAEQRRTKAISDLRVLTAGVEEKDNWQLLYRFINLALPRPDGSNLSDEAARYVHDPKWSKNSRIAFQMVQDRRVPPPKKEEITSEQKAREDEFIKRFLIQINIEGICQRYTEDLGPFFKNISDGSKLRGMEESEKDEIKRFLNKEPNTLPKKGWVVEVRGYTYHEDGATFVESTFLANLRPHVAARRMKDKKELTDTEQLEKMVQRVAGAPANYWKEKDPAIPAKVGYFHVFKGFEDRIKNPEPGKFHFLNQSYLLPLMNPGVGKGGPRPEAPVNPEAPVEQSQPKAEAKNRDAWKALGIARDIMAATTMPGPPAPIDNKDLLPGLAERTEFVIFFVWSEIITGEARDAPKQETP